MGYAATTYLTAVGDTVHVAARLEEFVAQPGDVVIDLGAGEPDFPTPAHIVEAAKAALDDDGHEVHGQKRDQIKAPNAGKPRERGRARGDRHRVYLLPARRLHARGSQRVSLHPDSNS